MKRSQCVLFIFSSNGRGHDSKCGAPASHYYMKYSVYTCCIIWFQIGQRICDEMYVYHVHVAIQYIMYVSIGHWGLVVFAHVTVCVCLCIFKCE